MPSKPGPDLNPIERVFAIVHGLVHARLRASGCGRVGVGNEFRRKLVRVALKVASASVPYRPRGQGASTDTRESAKGRVREAVSRRPDAPEGSFEPG
jgi:hypothetical protein